MRTTLTIDDDVLAAARDLAAHQNKTIGEIVSDLARQSLVRPVARLSRNGFPLLPITNPNAIVTSEHVRALDEEKP